MQLVHQVDTLPVRGPAHVLWVHVVTVDCIGGSFRRRTFGDALCNRRLRLGAERREHLASQAYAVEEAGDPRANLSEVLGDAAPMDVVGPRPEVERTGWLPPPDPKQLS